MSHPVGVRLVLSLVALAAAIVYGLAPLHLPRVQPADIPAADFSAARAMAHVAAIAREPHPAGSTDMARVADYLMQELARDRLDPHVQVVDDPKVAGSGQLRSVYARIPGSQPTGAVLLLAHPDSTPYGPGAGDNAAGAAALLEVARALTAGPPLRNDVIVLFDDGEELGYDGGYAFAEHNPWMADVRLVVGMDQAARAPVTVLQTAPDNGQVVRGYADAVRAPVAFGFYAAVDRTLTRDDSELEPFIRRGLPGIELEDPSGFVDRHGPGDTLDRLNAGSVQSMGDQVLALARGYGRIDLRTARTGDATFTTLRGLGVVAYPGFWGLLLACGEATIFLAIVVLGRRRGVLRLSRLLRAFLLGLVSVAAITVLGAGGGLLSLWLFRNPNPHNFPAVLPVSLPYLVALGLGLAGLFALAYRRIQRTSSPTDVAVGFLGIWLLLALLTALLLPLGGYLFAWPLLLALLIWLPRMALAPGADPARGPLALLLPGMLVVVLTAPVAALGYAATGALSLVLLAPLTALILGLWLPGIGLDTATESESVVADEAGSAGPRRRVVAASRR